MQDLDPRMEAFLGTVTSASSTVKMHRGDLRDFARWCADRDVDLRCTADDVAMYMRQLHVRGLASATIARYGWTLRKFYAWMLATGKIDSDPTVGVSKKFERGRRTDVLDLADLRRLVAHSLLNSQDAAVVLLFAVLGLTMKDVVNAQVPDLKSHGAGGLLRLSVEWDAPIPVPPFVMDVLKDAIGTRRHGPLLLNNWGKPAQNGYIKRVLQRVADDAGIPTRVTPAVMTHSARHNALSEGFSFVEVVHGMPQGRHENLVLRARELPPPRRPASYRMAALLRPDADSTAALLDQADALATSDTHPAVRVMLAGAAFERHVRSLVETSDALSRVPRKADKMGIGTWTGALVGKRVLSKDEKRLCDDIADRRTEAAHGHFHLLDNEIADTVVETARRLIVAHPLASPIAAAPSPIAPPSPRRQRPKARPTQITLPL